jgi:LCP family protein required for cell wall assembly
LADKFRKRRISMSGNRNRIDVDSDSRRTDRSDKNMEAKAKRRLKAKKKRKRRRIILIIEILVLIILGVLLFLYSKFGKIDFKNVGQISVNKLDNKTKDMLSGYTTLALFGVDSRDQNAYDTGNSDTIIVCVIDNKAKEIKLMSVYRDTYLDATGDQTFRKCNYAYNHGGPSQAMAMLNRNLDLDIQDYVSVNWKALADVVDAIGGIEVDVTQQESDALMGNKYGVLADTMHTLGRKTSGVGPGMQTLDGVQALAYCRIRHDAGDDYARTERQRKVISIITEKIKKGGPARLNKVMDAVFPEISTSLKMNQIVGLATNMKDYKFGKNTGFPFQKSGKIVGKAGDSIVPCTLESNVKLMYQFLYGETDYTPSETVKGLSNIIKKNS